MRLIRHILLVMLCAATLSAPAAPNSQRDSITSAKEADAFLRVKDHKPGYESQIIPAMQLLSHSRTYRDSMPLYCARALYFYGWDMLETGWLDISTQLLEKALVYCLPTDSATYYAIQSGLAYIDLRKGRRDKARKTLERVTDYHRRTDNPDFLARDIASMGSYYDITDSQAEALKMYRDALDMCKKSGNSELECNLLLRIGSTFGDFEQRDSMLTEAVRIEFEKNFTHLYSATYTQLGRLYLDNGMPQKALTVAKEALGNARRYRQDNEHVQSLLLLADTYAALGEWQLANSNSREAANIITYQKNRMDPDISTASLMAQTLIRWCDDNVVVTPNGFTITEEKERRLAVYVWILAAAIVLASLIFLYSAVVRRKLAARLAEGVTKEKITALEQANDSLAVRTKEQSRAIRYLLLFHSNFNPFMGKLRGMVMKATGKDEATNTAVRNIGAFISNNMLPPYSTELDGEARREEEAFMERLLKQYPDLSENDKQMCIYLRMGLSTQEICVLTGNQPRSVNMTRYRLRKALNLSESDNLEAVIARI